jgi:hypothetical protein
MKKLFLFVYILFAGWHNAANAQSIDLGTLLDEMTDLKRLTELPDPA